MRILIIGGGPSGVACGIELARNGVETVLFEAGPPDRDKTCGDALVPTANLRSRILDYCKLLQLKRSTQIKQSFTRNLEDKS
jgi:flavin-dependent dehydrogenase